MRNKLLLIVLLILGVSVVAVAQDFPRAEVFAGYSYLHSDLDPNFPPYGGDDNDFDLMTGELNGFEFSFTQNVNSWLGIKADFSSYFGDHDLGRVCTSEYNEEYGDDYSYDWKDTTTYSGKAQVRKSYYLFGPEFSYRGNEKVRPFAHALFGFNNTKVKDLDEQYVEVYENYTYEYMNTYVGSTTGSFSSTGFSLALGGGLDVNLGDNFAIRLFQIDYIRSSNNFEGEVQWMEDEYDGDYPDGDYDLYSHREAMETIPRASVGFNDFRVSAGAVIKF